MLKLPYSLNCLVPSTIENPVRIGCVYDGGYIIPQAIVDMSDNLLSCGLGDNWSFDSHWKQLKPNSIIHMYDGTVNQSTLPDYLQGPYLEFFTTHAVHFCENIGPEHTSISTAIERLGPGNIFLKMDIEGGEYQVLDEILSHKDRIPGIVMEIHFLNRRRERFISAINKLREHYELVHTHGNNHTVLGPDGVCDCLEFTFVRKDLVTDTDKRWNFYLDQLDITNVAGIDDYVFYGTDIPDEPNLITITIPKVPDVL